MSEKKRKVRWHRHRTKRTYMKRSDVHCSALGFVNVLYCDICKDFVMVLPQGVEKIALKALRGEIPPLK